MGQCLTLPNNPRRTPGRTLVTHSAHRWSVTSGSQEGNGIGSNDNKACGLFWGMQVVSTAPLHCLTFWQSTVGLLSTKLRFSPLYLASVEHSHDTSRSRMVLEFLGVVASLGGQSVLLDGRAGQALVVCYSMSWSLPHAVQVSWEPCCVLIIPVHALRGRGRDADAYPWERKIQKISFNKQMSR